MLSRGLQRLVQWYTPTRRMKTYIPKHYEAIPHYYKPIFIDIHDSYQLRSKQQIKKELDGVEYTYELDMLCFPNDLDASIKERKVVMRFDIAPFRFTKLQRERFKVLMGPRYNPDSNEQKITVDMLPTFQQNAQKADEMFYELIVQAKRAP